VSQVHFSDRLTWTHLHRTDIQQEQLTGLTEGRWHDCNLKLRPYPSLPVKLDTLKGSETPADAYTEQFLAACNDFDRASVVAQAKGMSQ